ncbi:MAG: carboxymuconolactone decarboxylase family protein [Alphaproteobacteria bacterium]
MQKPSGNKDTLAKVLPAFIEYTNELLYGEVWERSELSPRDRSLITIASLMAQNKMDQLPNHLKFGLKNGLTVEEISEAITHLAFYASWPNAIQAGKRFLEVVEDQEKEAAASE